MQLTLVLDSTVPRQWHVDLASRLSSSLSAGVHVVPGRSPDRSDARALQRLMRLERFLHGLDQGGMAPVGTGVLDHAGRDDHADVVVDLGAEPGTGWTVLYDGHPGELAAARALSAGRFPVVTVVDPQGVVRAAGRPGSEQPGLLAAAVPDVLAGVGTLLVGALQGCRFVPPVPDPAPPPSAAPMAWPGLATRRVAGFVVHSAYRALTRTPHWRVGWRPRRDEDASTPGSGSGWVDLPDDGYHFYADPFLFERDGRAYLFVEDYDHRLGKGVISVVELGSDGPVGAPRRVLEHDAHLSYPVVLEHDGVVWMIPETSGAGTIELYRATRFPDSWELDSVLVSGLAASDATPFQHDGRWWMTATVRHGGSFSDHLHLWSAPDLRGPWSPHAGNPVLVDIASARPAGHVVLQHGKLLRPTQDCREGYGVATNLMEVTRLDDEGFEQRQVARLAPSDGWPGRRLHTVNASGRFEVIDGSRLSPRLPRLRHRPARLPGAPTQADSTQPAPGLVIVANPSADVYGSDLQMLESVSALVDDGYRVVVTTPDDGPLIDRLRGRGAVVERLPYPVLRRAHASALGLVHLGWDGLRSAAFLARFLRARRPVVVYVNTVTLPWWILAARLARIPVVCHVHEAERQDRLPLRLALYLPLVASGRVIVNSRVTGQTVAEVVPGMVRRSALIYNGVQGPDGPSSTPDPGREPFRLVLVTRLSPRKGVDVALEAVALARAAGIDVRLDVCGTPFNGYEWFEQELLERAARDDLRGAVTFSGYVSPVWPALARAHAALATSLGESLGNAVIEAQLANRPVIASQVSGHVETVVHGHNGLLVPARDPQALAEAISLLARDPALADRLSAVALQEARERFSPDRYRDQVREVVRALV